MCRNESCWKNYVAAQPLRDQFKRLGGAETLNGCVAK